MTKTLAVTLLALSCLLAGCTSYSARVNPGVDLASRQTFFVKSNLNDSHAMDRHIASALTARGRKVEVGPLTMMPPDAQVVVEYEDKWVWDFGEHLVGVQITMREPKGDRPIASNQFTARMSMIRNPAEVVDRMVGEIIDGKGTKSK